LKEEESEGFSWDEVEMRFLDVACARFGLAAVAKGVIGSLHLLELMYDGGMEFVFVGEVSLVIIAG
jgi:hypothetical protein